jgi:hypothetical protein
MFNWVGIACGRRAFPFSFTNGKAPGGTAPHQYSRAEVGAPTQQADKLSGVRGEAA